MAYETLGDVLKSSPMGIATKEWKEELSQRSETQAQKSREENRLAGERMGQQLQGVKTPAGPGGSGLFEKASQPAPPPTGTPASADTGNVMGDISVGVVRDAQRQASLQSMRQNEQKVTDELTRKANVGGMERYAEKGWNPEPGNEYAFRTTNEGGVTKIEGRGLGSPDAYAGGGGGVGGAGLDKKIEDLIDRVSSQKSLYADIELTKALVGEKGARERAMIGLEGTKYGADASRVTAEERAADRQLARDELNFYKEQDRKMRERTASDETIKSFSIMRNGKQGPRELGLLRMGLSGMTIDEFNLPAVQLELKKYYAKRDAFKKQREAAGKDFDEELFLRDYEKIYGVEE